MRGLTYTVGYLAGHVRCRKAYMGIPEERAGLERLNLVTRKHGEAANFGISQCSSCTRTPGWKVDGRRRATQYGLRIRNL